MQHLLYIVACCLIVFDRGEYLPVFSWQGHGADFALDGPVHSRHKTTIRNMANFAIARKRKAAAALIILELVGEDEETSCKKEPENG